MVGVEHWEIRHGIGRSHVSEYDSLEFVNGVRTVTEFFVIGIFGPIRRFENCAVWREMPTVIAATNTIVRRDAKFP